MLNPVQIDNVFCFVKSRPAFISNEELFVYAFYLGYLIIDNDYSGMQKLPFCPFALDIESTYQYCCTRCGDDYFGYLHRTLCNGKVVPSSVDTQYSFINPHSQRTIFSVHHRIRF